MSHKKYFYTELAYFFGVITLAFGTSLMERVGFGMSVVVAPAYILHLKISEYFPFFSFGMAEYTLQAVLLIFLSVIVKNFKITYLLSFVTALFYGATLDLFIKIVGLFPHSGFAVNLFVYVVGILFCDIGIMFMFHTYLSPEVYELLIKEVSKKFEIDISRFKLLYDICSCIVSVILSFLFFGFLHFRGVKAGTVFCALVNGFIIGAMSTQFEKKFVLKDMFPFRKAFDS